jgi:serine/threonine-protein kinase
MPLSSSELRDQLQATLSGSYTLERELRGGGMSRVFLAEELRFKRKVVVKVLLPELAQGISVERFEREIQTVAALQHANIVPVHAAGDTNGIPFYTMPFVEGESLRARLGRGPLPVTEILGILRDVSKALAYAHQRGVVHRDIKPDNVLMSGGVAVVTDFGIAKAISAARTSAGGATLTQAGSSIGTPAYMAPEQVAGDPNVDHYADIYSLGAMAYELLTGGSPFAGRPVAQILAAHMIEVPPPIAERRPDVPVQLADLVTRCLEKKPRDRPASADELVRALDAVQSSGSLGSPAFARHRTRVPRWARLTAAAFGVAVVLATAAILLLPRSLRATAWTVVTRSAAVLHQGRVVVAPFENRTGDQTLDPLGDMAADWIAQGLSRVPDAEVVDARSAILTSRVVEHIPTLLRSSNNARALGEEVGAGTVVMGSFYRNSDSLSFEVQILDVASGRLTRSLTPVSGPARSPGALVERVREVTVGALAAVALDSTMAGISRGSASPPSYDAYLEFTKGFFEFMRRGPKYDSLANVHYARAAALDTTYGIPMVAAAFAAVDRADYHDWTAWPVADSLARRAEQRRAWLSAGDGALLDYVEARINGNRDATLQSAQQALRLFPGSVEIPILAASVASRFGRDSLALAILSTTNPRRGLNLVSTLYWTNLANSLQLLGRFRQLADTMGAGRRQFPEDRVLADRQLLALAALGNADEVERMLLKDPLLSKMRHTSPWVSAGLGAVRELRWKLHDAGADRILALVKEEQRRWPLDTAAEPADSAAQVVLDLRIAARDWDGAHELAAALAKRDSADLDAMAVAAATAAYGGDREAAIRASSSIQKLTQRETRGHAFEAAHGAYLQAMIACALGNREQAVALLARALADGRYHPWNVLSDPMADLFLPLRDYAPFVQLMTPTR